MAWQGTMEAWSKGCDKALKLMEKELEKAIKKNDENKGKKLDKFRKMIHDYPTEQDVIEAYGYEMVTEKQKDELIEALRAGEEKATELDEFDSYIYLIITFIEDLRREKGYAEVQKDG